MTSGHYPDEPHLRSEIALLSPASPKPLHFPTPTNIPVLDNMMDVGFNQTELHMADPAMHNTELRPGAWQDPNAPKDDRVGQAPAGNAVATQAAPRVADSQAGAQQASARDTLPNMSLSQNASPHGVSDASVAQPTASFVVPNPSATESASHHAAFPTHATEANHAQSSATPLNGEVDVQALLNTLQSNSAHANSAHAGDGLHVATASSPSQPRAPGIDSSPVSAAGLGAPPSGLPPRPPPQEQPLINANYSHSQHIRDYHPHAANPAYQNTTGRSSHAANSADTSSQSFVPPVHVSTESAAPGTESSFSNPPPMNAQEQQAALGAAVNRTQGNTPLESRREYKIAAGLNLSEDDQPWTADTQRKYDKFIEDERKYVSEGRWEQFPHGSRLFVGNLSSERVTKRDIFHAFHRYGDLAQISIKQAYGFVQFLRPQDCAAALSREEGRQIRGKKIHLEVSKPQRNRNPQDSRAPLSPVNTRRRSRSPDYNRGGNDRYAPTRSNYGGGRDDRDGRGGRDRERDGYRPYRSPSPPPRGDRYRDDRYRDRSPPYTRGGRYSRNHSPTDLDDGLPLPKRAPQNVPDVQIISNENLNRDFINWIEKAFQGRGLTVDVLYLSPRLDFDAVVRRQLVEGVLAVCRLSRANQDTGLINLRLFDRTGAGANNIKFDDYDNQDLQICVELVSRKKQSMWGHQPPQQPPQQHYGYGQAPSAAYGMPPAPPPGYPPGYLPPPTLPPAGGLPPGAPVPPNLQQLITSLDPKGLQNLLAAMQPAGAPQAYTPQHSFAPHQQAAITALQHNPSALAGYLQQQQSQQSTPAQPSQRTSPPNSGAQVNMQEILARLGTYK